MNRPLVSFLLLLLTASLMTGCGESRPAGMPRLYPATITITQEGTPLDGALVQLIPEDSANSSWGPGGTTDASGRVVLQTNGKYKGAPLGEYKVTVSKKEKEPHPNPELQGGQEFRKYLAILKTLKTYSFVEPQYGSIKDTPLNIEITAKEKTYTVDAGKKVKVAVKVLQ